MIAQIGQGIVLERGAAWAVYADFTRDTPATTHRLSSRP